MPSCFAILNCRQLQKCSTYKNKLFLSQMYTKISCTCMTSREQAMTSRDNPCRPMPQGKFSVKIHLHKDRMILGGDTHIFTKCQVGYQYFSLSEEAFNMYSSEGYILVPLISPILYIDCFHVCESCTSIVRILLVGSTMS